MLQTCSYHQRACSSSQLSFRYSKAAEMSSPENKAEGSTFQVRAPRILSFEGSVIKAYERSCASPRIGLEH